VNYHFKLAFVSAFWPEAFEKGRLCKEPPASLDRLHTIKIMRVSGKFPTMEGIKNFMREINSNSE
jgi:hypothetical protein